MKGRRPSGAYMSVPASQGDLPKFDSAQRIEPHPRINQIRDRVVEWRQNGYPGASRVTRELLEFWSGESIEPRPFFCQVEALETLIWLVEAGPKTQSSDWKSLRTEVDALNADWNEGIPRLAVKMATGTGKTRVMAMVALWLAFTRRSRTDFLVLSPNLTVRERLAELDPKGSGELYRSLTPPNRVFPAGHIHVTVLNFQAFQRRDILAIAGSGDKATGVAKRLLRPHSANGDERWTEDSDAMIARLLATHRGAKEIFVLNDEAHHCYRPAQAVKRGDRETKEYEEQASLWFNALRALQAQARLGLVFDLSATPMYLRRPPNLDHDLFPWIVSDYPLIEAVEAGLTKIPRVPVRDDTEEITPIYRDTYNQLSARDRVIRRDRVPKPVTDLLKSLHDDYRALDGKYAEVGITPVMIVVANNKKLAEGFYQHIGGYWDEKAEHWVPGAYEMFANVLDGGPVSQPPTLLVHSGIEDAGQDAAKTSGVAELQKDFFSAGEGATKAENAAYIRRAFNTVGVEGDPGHHIRCIVSVSMLTEGWDVRTVTHIFGFRPFKSELLCEQVAGRALRRTSFALDGTNLEPEYARIFGVPFSFMRGDDQTRPQPPSQRWPVETVPNKQGCRITFPNVAGYRIEHPQPRCHLESGNVTSFKARNPTTPTKTHVAGVVGSEDDMVHERRGETHIVYSIAKDAIRLLLEGAEDNDQPRRGRLLFASMVEAVRQWLRHPLVEYKDIAHLTRAPNVEEVPRQIAKACALDNGSPQIVPVFMDQHDPGQQRTLDTSSVSFQTSLKNRYPSATTINAVRSELNAAACHTRGEARVAGALDLHPGILSWVRNFRLGWNIPYLDPNTGIWRIYEPDFIARCTDDDHLEPRYLVIEFKGVVDEDATTKRKEVEEWWIPAVNGSRDPACYGRWRYVFINGEKEIKKALNDAAEPSDRD